MRILVLILLIANLAFAAWARFIDRPGEPPAAHDISRLPRLVLAGEAHGGAPAVPPVPSAGSSTPASGDAGRSAPGNQAAVAVTGRPGEAGLATQVPADRCVSVGPFTEPANAAAAVLMLQSKGMSARQRSEEERYWVDVDLQRAAEVPMGSLLQLQQPGAQLSVRDCPGSAAANAPAGKPVSHAAARPG